MAVPPQRAPDVLRPPISGFLTQCEQIENTSREKMRNSGTPRAHLDKAERAKVFDDEGCKHNGFGHPALYTSNGSPPTPSPPLRSSRSLSNVSTSFPTLVTMGGVAPGDACPPPAVLTEWRCYACHDSIGGSNMVNLRSGEQLWQPPASDWDVLEWDIEYTPNPKGTWYRVPGSRRWVHLDYITSWIHWPTKYTWYLVEDTARPTCARPPLPHQIEFILARLTLRRMTTRVATSAERAPTEERCRYDASARAAALAEFALVEEGRRHNSGPGC
jgi:hypothetical protein